MEAIEQAIRNALSKSDANNPAIRQKIYESAWGAHERSLAANGALDDDQREDRRERLKASITRIEKEIQTEGSLIPPPAPAPVEERREPVLSGDTVQTIQPASRIEPSLGVVPEPDLGVPESASDGPVAADNYRPDRLRPRLTRKAEHKKAGGLSKLLILFALLAVALGLLWLVASGIINSKPSSIPPSTGNPATSDSNEPMKEGQISSEGTWITIFDPSDSTGVSVSGRATASVDGDQPEKFLRIKSPGEADDISFAVGEGVLDQLVGKHAVFDIIAKSEDGTSTQIAVSCDFGSLGDCGRTRFDVSDANAEFLVQKQFPADKKPNAGGVIKINSDVSQAGKSVDIISIRVQITN
ncbi:hypothetical protein CU102_14080 [Phyllobacterium brassicacearum]|uniref:Biotin transporter BioY n=1 Tax=Phyllobacterium brassicacearum TaxID=314235 RepID=A0A2P7BPL0_9HYPH|nr:hypothetical protein [Phyllobacterium brassicacearum]PSH68409.1 hypothetical protein CU102_14080 [Phyllobacterium brassicacearum]TDQ31710.1 hypothetical protein DEV91_10746 [Phyllobacterium brassicacearum]